LTSFNQVRRARARFLVVRRFSGLANFLQAV